MNGNGHTRTRPNPLKPSICRRNGHLFPREQKAAISHLHILHHSRSSVDDSSPHGKGGYGGPTGHGHSWLPGRTIPAKPTSTGGSTSQPVAMPARSCESPTTNVQFESLKGVCHWSRTCGMPDIRGEDVCYLAHAYVALGILGTRKAFAGVSP